MSVRLRLRVRVTMTVTMRVGVTVRMRVRVRLRLRVTVRVRVRVKVTMTVRLRLRVTVTVMVTVMVRVRAQVSIILRVHLLPQQPNSSLPQLPGLREHSCIIVGRIAYSCLIPCYHTRLPPAVITAGAQSGAHIISSSSNS